MLSFGTISLLFYSFISKEFAERVWRGWVVKRLRGAFVIFEKFRRAINTRSFLFIGRTLCGFRELLLKFLDSSLSINRLILWTFFIIETWQFFLLAPNKGSIDSFIARNRGRRCFRANNKAGTLIWNGRSHQKMTKLVWIQFNTTSFVCWWSSSLFNKYLWIDLLVQIFIAVAKCYVLLWLGWSWKEFCFFCL